MESEYLKSERQRAALLQLVFILAQVATEKHSAPDTGAVEGESG